MNAICNLLQIKYPIIQGGMGNISNAQLTAAVSEAGGLGTIGCGTLSPAEVEAIICETKRLTNKPFAINIPIQVSPYTKELVMLAIQHQVGAVSLSAGNPASIIPILKGNSIKVMAVVASVKHAKKAAAAGADMLVAEGFEAAGINSNLELTTFTLIPQIVEQVSIPVAAAGGIADGKGLAAAWMLGAHGVQMGTRFISVKEAPFHDTYKKRVMTAADTETMIIGRSIGQMRRILRSPYGEQIAVREAEGITKEEYQQLTSEVQHVNGALKGDGVQGFMNGGQIAGLITDMPTVEELLEKMMWDAKKQLEHGWKQCNV
ncbi:2-nitropropane dioxygenase [Ornithinibacillus gellani]|uniref:NAD(P)H-dependent flavin oxidoreductase n=1 Tax=Ornithinibacillus gellani TaxID=2293253 RepID=UPI000F4A2352|nr:nitronate monooxygenase [Ornithinibacillus gellani]TQS72013.1 2-nitropropane dioxygenase [Ornithinibacillus gellani]